MEIEKPSISEKVAELRQHGKNCRMAIVRKLPPMLPHSGRKMWPVLRFRSSDQSGRAARVPGAGYARFYWLLRHGTAAGATRLMRIMAKGRTALTALFYDGTVATKCIELTKYDTGGRFRMSIRPKSGTFYDENSAFNK